MRVSIADLTSAISKVKSFASTLNEAPGIMLNLQKDKLFVCYSDGRRSLIEELCAEPEDGDITGKIVMGYDRLVYIIDMCQPSGTIKVDEIQFSFEEEKTIMHIKAQKYTIVQRPTGTYDEDGAQIYEEVRSNTSTVSQQAKYNHIEDSIRFGVLSRMDYDSIFRVNEEGYDVWDKNELRTILKKAVAKDGKAVYISAVYKSGFAVNTAYTVTVPCESCESNGFITDATVAKALMEILNQISTERVRIKTTDKRYVNIADETDTVGIWFEMQAASKLDNNALKGYISEDYTDFEIVLHRDSIANVVDNVMKSTKDDKTVLTFGEDDEGNKVIFINVRNTGASTEGRFTANIEGREVYRWEELKELKLPISIKVFKETIANCETPFIVIGLAFTETKRLMRLAEAMGKDDEGNIITRTCHYMVVTK